MLYVISTGKEKHVMLGDTILATVSIYVHDVELEQSILRYVAKSLAKQNIETLIDAVDPMMAYVATTNVGVQ